MSSVESQGFGRVEHVVFDGTLPMKACDLLRRAARDPQFAIALGVGGRSRTKSRDQQRLSYRVGRIDRLAQRGRSVSVQLSLHGRQAFYVSQHRPDLRGLHLDRTKRKVLYSCVAKFRSALRPSLSPGSLHPHNRHVLSSPHTRRWTSLARRPALRDGLRVLRPSDHLVTDFSTSLRLSPIFASMPQVSRLHSQNGSERNRNKSRGITRVLANCSPRWAGPVLVGLRAAAAVRRYSEKALRGYYFSQYRPL